MVYTQPKKNAYKISSSGKYGGLMIDIPKLMGQLRLVATKDKRKVMDKKVDFDTIDLLTKRFNSKKKYSDIAKMVFDELTNSVRFQSINPAKNSRNWALVLFISMMLMI